MKFRATIRNAGGATEKRVIDAPTRFSVYDQLRGEGVAVMNLEEAGTGFHLPDWLNLTIGSPVKHAVVIHFVKNLASMLAAGLSLSRALSIVERQSSNARTKAVVIGVEEGIRQGLSFHESLEKYPRVFSKLLVAMAEAGEASGSLAESLRVVALQMERTDELIKKVRGAMIYPAIVLSAIVVVAVLMLIFVVPVLTKTFQSLGVKLPLATRVIVATSTFVVGNLVLVICGLIALIIFGIFLVRSRQGRSVILRTALLLPIIGDLVRETYAARTARTLASLLAAGVPVLDALAITKDTLGTSAFAEVITEAEERVRKGEPLSTAFTAHPKLFPILMSDMILVGEETGKVSEMLRQIAELYEADTAERTKDLSTIMEPLLTLLIGTFVGIFAVAIIAPIYSLSSAI